MSMSSDAAPSIAVILRDLLLLTDRVAALEAAGKAPAMSEWDEAASRPGRGSPPPKAHLCGGIGCEECGDGPARGHRPSCSCQPSAKPAPETGRSACDERCVGTAPEKTALCGPHQNPHEKAFCTSPGWRCDGSGPAHQPAPAVTREELAEALRNVLNQQPKAWGNAEILLAKYDDLRRLHGKT